MIRCIVKIDTWRDKKKRRKKEKRRRKKRKTEMIRLPVCLVCIADINRTQQFFPVSLSHLNPRPSSPSLVHPVCPVYFILKQPWSCTRRCLICRKIRGQSKWMFPSHLSAFLTFDPPQSSSFTSSLHPAPSEDQSDRRTACTRLAPQPLTLTRDIDPVPAARTTTLGRSGDLEERAAGARSSARASRDVEARQVS